MKRFFIHAPQRCRSHRPYAETITGGYCTLKNLIRVRVDQPNKCPWIEISVLPTYTCSFCLIRVKKRLQNAVFFLNTSSKKHINKAAYNGTHARAAAALAALSEQRQGRSASGGSFARCSRDHKTHGRDARGNLGSRARPFSYPTRKQTVVDCWLLSVCGEDLIILMGDHLAVVKREYTRD